MENYNNYLNTMVNGMVDDMSKERFNTPYMSFPSEALRYIENILSKKPLMYFPKTSEEVEFNNKLEEGDFDKVDLIELFSNDDYQSIDSMLVGCSKTKDIVTFNLILSIANLY